MEFQCIENHALVSWACTDMLDFVFRFKNLGIQYCARGHILKSLENREKIQVDPFGTGFLNSVSIDLSVVRLAFQCFLPDKSGKYTWIVPPVVSQPIYDDTKCQSKTFMQFLFSLLVFGFAD